MIRQHLTVSSRLDETSIRIESYFIDKLYHSTVLISADRGRDHLEQEVTGCFDWFRLVQRN